MCDFQHGILQTILVFGTFQHKHVPRSVHNSLLAIRYNVNMQAARLYQDDDSRIKSVHLKVVMCQFLFPHLLEGGWYLLHHLHINLNFLNAAGQQISGFI